MISAFCWIYLFQSPLTVKIPLYYLIPCLTKAAKTASSIATFRLVRWWALCHSPYASLKPILPGYCSTIAPYTWLHLRPLQELKLHRHCLTFCISLYHHMADTQAPRGSLFPSIRQTSRLCNIHILHRFFFIASIAALSIFISSISSTVAVCIEKSTAFSIISSKKLLTLFLCKLFAVVYPSKLCPYQHHSRCKHISCKRTSAGFIAAAHHVWIFSYLVVNCYERRNTLWFSK